MKSRYEGIQNKLWDIREGCFFLSLLSIAEEYRLEHGMMKVDLIDAVNMAFEQKYITFDYFVRFDCEILSKLTGQKVTKRKAKSCGTLKANEYSVAKYEKKTVNKDGKEVTVNHFRRRYFDVYANSSTVREGKLVEYYIYTIGV